MLYTKSVFFKTGSAFIFFYFTLVCLNLAFAKLWPPSFYEHAMEPTSVLEVRGKHFRGNGVFIVVATPKGDRPMILTNSHLLEGEKNAEINWYGHLVYQNEPFPNYIWLKLEDSVAVNFDSPDNDIALLSLPSSLTKDEQKYFMELGYLNARFYRKGVDQPNKKLALYANRVAVQIDGKRSILENIEPWRAVLLPDQYISGLFEQVFSIPVYGRHGISGGAFYEFGKFSGLVTKVDLSVSPYVYAIPVSEIAKVFISDYFNPNTHSQSQGSWKMSPEGVLSLEIKIHEDVILASTHLGGLGTAGGELGNGGGEIGNGGGELGNGGDDGVKYWELEISDIYNYKRKIVTANPFSLKPQSLRINDKKIAYFEVKDPIRPEFPILVAPTSAKYIWNLNHPHQAPPMQIVYSDVNSRKKVLERRSMRFNFSEYARVYKKTKAGHYEHLSINFDTFTGDHAQALFPSGDLTRGSKVDWIYQITKMPSEAPQTKPGEYFPGYPFRARENLEMFLDVIERDQSLKIEVPCNLSRSVLITNLSDGSEPIALNSVSDPEEITQIFRSEKKEHKGYQAALIFRNEDLGKLERIFVETPTHLYEFPACHPGEDCIR